MMTPLPPTMTPSWLGCIQMAFRVWAGVASTGTWGTEANQVVPPSIVNRIPPLAPWVTAHPVRSLMNARLAGVPNPVMAVPVQVPAAERLWTILSSTPANRVKLGPVGAWSARMDPLGAPATGVQVDPPVVLFTR